MRNTRIMAPLSSRKMSGVECKDALATSGNVGGDHLRLGR